MKKLTLIVGLALFLVGCNTMQSTSERNGEAQSNQTSKKEEPGEVWKVDRSGSKGVFWDFIEALGDAGSY